MSFRAGSDGALRNLAVSGIDSNYMTISLWVYVESAPTAIECIVQIAASGEWRTSIQARPPVSSGWQLYFLSRWSAGNGVWRHYADLNLNTWYHVIISYPRTVSTYNPVIYVNKVFNIVEENTPDGTAYGSDNEIHVGSNAGGSYNFTSGIVSDLAYWSDTSPPTGMEDALADGVPAFDWAHQLDPANLEAYWLSTFQAYKKEPIQQAHLSDYGSGGAFDTPNPPLHLLRLSRANYYPPPAIVAQLGLKPLDPLVGMNR